MKKDKSNFLIIIVLTTLLILAAYCSRSDTPKSEHKKYSKEENQVILDELTNIELENESEKIILLSLIHKVPADSLILILKDYNSKTSIDYDHKYLNKVIDTISEKFKLPKSKIAIMIYNFKYNSREIGFDLNQNNEYIPDSTIGPDSESGYRY